VAQPATFGRRGLPPKASSQAPGRLEPLSPELEAFAASLKDAEFSDTKEFARWRRNQLPRRLLMILVRVAFMAPGLICFADQAPWWVSSGFEVAGLFANGWLVRERRRQTSAIAAWTPGSQPGSGA
jgi:hypothetical protein